MGEWSSVLLSLGSSALAAAATWGVYSQRLRRAEEDVTKLFGLTEQLQKEIATCKRENAADLKNYVTLVQFEATMEQIRDLKQDVKQILQILASRNHSQL
jgi:tellurite resistance protein